MKMIREHLRACHSNAPIAVSALRHIGPREVTAALLNTTPVYLTEAFGKAISVNSSRGFPWPARQHVHARAEALPRRTERLNDDASCAVEHASYRWLHQPPWLAKLCSCMAWLLQQTNHKTKHVAAGTRTSTRSEQNPAVVKVLRGSRPGKSTRLRGAAGSTQDGCR